MMARRGMLAAFASGSTMLLAACGLLGPAFPRYRFRLNVEVETPGGLRTGSSVYEVQTSRTGSLFPASPNQMEFDVRGEAAVVNLPGGAMFTVLDSGWLGSVMINASEYHRRSARSASGLIEPSQINTIAQDQAKLALPRRFTSDDWNSGYPKMVRFRSEQDPASVEWVDPDNLAASFGGGVKVGGLSVQITDDPVVINLPRRLAWLEDYARSGKRLNGRTDVAIMDNLANNKLGSGAFVSIKDL